MTRRFGITICMAACGVGAATTVSAETNDYWNVLEAAIASYAEHRSDFNKIVEQFAADSQLVGLGISAYAESATETCRDHGVKEVCGLTYDLAVHQKYVDMGVTQIRRNETRISFDSPPVEIGKSVVYVTFVHSDEDEPIAQPCDRSFKYRDIDSCAYDLGEGWWINLGFAVHERRSEQ